MKAIFNSLFNNIYRKSDWQLMKFSLIIYWIPVVSLAYSNCQSIPFPTGICSIIPCDLLQYDLTKIIFKLITLCLLVFYVFEFKMLYTTLLIFLMSLISFSAEESGGTFNRNGLLTFVFFAQFIAYAAHHYNQQSNLFKNRVQYSLQTVAIGYTLSALSKLYASGFNWIYDGRQIGLQIYKSYFSSYFDSGNKNALAKAFELTHYIEEHPHLVSCLLLSSLLLELFALISIRSKKTAFIYGLFLLSMHIGIYEVMDIIIMPIAMPMVIFMLNPLALAWNLLSSLLLQLLPKYYFEDTNIGIKLKRLFMEH